MKRFSYFLSVAIFMMLSFFIINSCKLLNDADDDDEEETTENQNNTSTTTAKVAQYFWGTWQSMADGTRYVISENNVDKEGSSYSVSSSTSTTLVVKTLGTFTKQSDSVMCNNSIPYFRKGGANLTYNMKLVGFSDDVARVASTTSLSGYTVTGKSDTYTSFKSETTSDAEGNISLTAPVSGDVQTVTVSSGGSNIAVVPGITVENNNSNMGTIPISTGGEYSLKITGTINESDKSDGYLYSDKSYHMTLTITNISEVGSAPSWCTIEAADSSLTVSGEKSFMISSLESNLTKTVNLTVLCSSTSSYVDTGLNVRVKNLKTEKTWTDFVPIRFYKGLLPITIATKSTENNSNAALNGFFIYPDGNSKFFQIPQGSYQTLYIPSFGDLGNYKLAFSGATIEGSLSNSTEMAYTVAIGTTIKKDVDISTEKLAMAAVQYGESGSGNETEDTAYSVSEDFTAYIAVKDIDFYTFNTSALTSVSPDNIVDDLSYSDSVSGTLSPYNSKYYSFYAYAGETYTISKTESGYCYISAGSTFDGTDCLNSSSSNTQSFTPSYSGTVYIKIYNGSSYYTSSYTLSVSDTSYSVHLLNITTQTGNLSLSSSYNIYSFEAQAGKNYTVTWNNADSAMMSVSAGNNSSSPSSYFSSTTESGQSISVSSAGTIYIKVKPYSSSYTGSYTLLITSNDSISLSLYTSGTDDNASSYTTLTPSSSTTWTTGTLTSNTQSIIYKFYAYSSYTYTVYWADSYEGKGNNDTVDVKVSASTSSDFSTSLFSNVDSGYSTGKTISGVSGYVYIKVVPYSSGNTGSFRIRIAK